MVERTARGHASVAVLPFFGALAREEFRLESDSMRYLLVGLLVGVVARVVVPGRHPFGLIGTIAVGVIGAVLGDWLAGNVFEETRGVDWLASILVAVVLVYLLTRSTRRRVFW